MADLEKMYKYEENHRLGEGTYGQVFMGSDRRTGRTVAIKKTKLEAHEEGIPPTVLREVSLLKNLRMHRNVVQLKNTIYSEDKKGTGIIYLVFEHLDCDLKRYMDKCCTVGQRLSKSQIKNIMKQLLVGVLACHAQGVMHRDLKPQNVLVDAKDKSNPLIKVADLGLGRNHSVPIKCYTHEIVTLWYRAPEVLLGATHYSLGVDMWSIGCMFAELYTNTPLFTGDSEFQQLVLIFQTLGTPNETVWPGVTRFKDWHEYPKFKAKNLKDVVPQMDDQALDLLSQMFVYNPKDRITAMDALRHPYFDDMDEPFHRVLRDKNMTV